MDRKYLKNRIVVSLIALTTRKLSKDKKLNMSTLGRHYSWDETKELNLLVFNPYDNWTYIKLDIYHDGHHKSNNNALYGEFIVSCIGDVEGDGRDMILSAVTLMDNCYLVSNRYRNGEWLRKIETGFKGSSIRFIRSMCMGDIDGDKKDEIVIGTRPSGHVLLLDKIDGGYIQTVLDQDAYGKDSTNTREVIITDLCKSGKLDIFAAIARADTLNWGSTPGSIFRYSYLYGGWTRTTIEDHNNYTHTRMLQAGDARNINKNELFSVDVGVLDYKQDEIIHKPHLNVYSLSGETINKECIDELSPAIKSRSIAIGDIDGDGQNELVLGTRNADERGKTYLLVYKYCNSTNTWLKSVIDHSGELGFHCIALVDLDNDGCSDIIASDDGKGLIKVYHWVKEHWDIKIILDFPHTLYAASINVMNVDV